jgi:hypothetical protein
MHHVDIAATARVAFSGLPQAEGEAWARGFVQHSAISFTNQLTYPGYKDVPVSFLLCEDDMCIPKNIQRDAIELIESESGNKVDAISIDADHCPMVSNKLSFIDWILAVVEKA